MHFGAWRPLRKVEHFYAYGAILFVVIDDDAWRYFFGAARGRVGQAERQGVDFLIDFEFHSAFNTQSDLR